ncbi:hypothetical protein EDB89DRAFT_670304 [Lactarius sanguifluus]|nr:hypothetical protein EDB89DRAFT_670304 [Lactarius sanguifluus]
MAEPAEPSRVAHLVALLYVPIPECLSTADVLVSINNVDARIILYRLIHRRRLSISSQADFSRPIFLLGMAMTRLERHMLSNQIKDLETSILHLTESLLFPLRSWLEHGPEILDALFFLALALIKRSEVSKRPEDAIHAAKYLRYLRDQPHQTFGISRYEVTTFLVHSLVIQVISEAGNVMRNIGEMAGLCHELLTSDMSHIYTTHAVTLFVTVVLFKFRPWEPDQPLDQVIECLRVATEHIYVCTKLASPLFNPLSAATV